MQSRKLLHISMQKIRNASVFASSVYLILTSLSIGPFCISMHKKDERIIYSKLLYDMANNWAQVKLFTS